MKGDFTRRTHDAKKDYSAVLVEQGRLVVDADLEEEHRILSGFHEHAVADLVGEAGGPLAGAGFAVTPAGADFGISKGVYYVDGILVTNHDDVLYSTQPHAPVPAPPPGRHAVVLDVWRRPVTVLDDPALREVALGGPTTSIREQTVWRVHAIPTPGDPAWSCGSPMPAAPKTTGVMAARATPEAATTTPCLVPPLAGYSGVENQFYRVEVFRSGDAGSVADALVDVAAFDVNDTTKLTLANGHNVQAGDFVEFVRTGGAGADPLDAEFSIAVSVAGDVVAFATTVPTPAGGATLHVRVLRGAVAVVSRENGSVVTEIERIDGSDVRVTDLGPDEALGFEVGQWVEITDDAIEFDHDARRRLHRIEFVDHETRTLTLTGAVDPLGTIGGIDPTRHAKLLRWDGARGIVTGVAPQEWIHLEHGIEVRFAAGGAGGRAFERDDSWCFAARTAVVDEASGKIEWPQDAAAPVALPPAGVERHRAVLAAIQVAANGDIEVKSDCRRLFPPVTELTNLLYVGGDGQEARAGEAGFPALSATLSVRVVNGSVPVPGARVQFSTPDGGALNPALAVADADGIVEATWALQPLAAAQTALAVLLDAAGSAVPHQRVRFAATIQRQAGHGGGCCVSIGADGDYGTIEEALDALLQQGESDICLCLRPGEHLVQDLPVDATALRRTLHLSIRGCGRTSRVRVQERFEFTRLASLRLADLDLMFENPAGENAGGNLHTLAVREVRLDNVRVLGTATEKTALVRVHDGTLVTVCDSVILPASGRERLRLISEELIVIARQNGDQRLEESFGMLRDTWAAASDKIFEDAGRRFAAGVLRTADDALSFQRALLAWSEPRAGAATLGLRASLRDLATRTDPRAAGRTLVERLRQVALAAALESGIVALEIGASSHDALEKGSTSEILVRDCLVAGDASFYGAASENRIFEELLKFLGDQLPNRKMRLAGRLGTVEFGGNHLGRLRVSDVIVQLLQRFAEQGDGDFDLVYGSFLAHDNVFEGARTADGTVVPAVVARRVAVTGNAFTLGGLESDAFPYVLGIAASGTTVVSNLGEEVPDTGELSAVQIAARVFDTGINIDLQMI